VKGLRAYLWASVLLERERERESESESETHYY
jgi:hypothetical protein